MKSLSTQHIALLGLALIGAILLIISQTSLIQDGALISAAGFAVLIISAMRLVDMTSPYRGGSDNNRDRQ